MTDEYVKGGLRGPLDASGMWVAKIDRTSDGRLKFVEEGTCCGTTHEDAVKLRDRVMDFLNGETPREDVTEVLQQMLEAREKKLEEARKVVEDTDQEVARLAFLLKELKELGVCR